jgi:hypothetical protein
MANHGAATRRDASMRDCHGAQHMPRMQQKAIKQSRRL